MTSEGDSSDLREGVLLAGRYRIAAPLGSGGYGTVYAAQDERTGQRVALKHLHVARLESGAARTRFAREAGFLLRLNHPNIVRALDYGETPGGAPFLVCELLDGVSLRAVLDAVRSLSLEATAALALDVLGALEAAHAQGIVHRDIKPANLFMPRPGTAGRVRVIDFGVSKALGGEGDQQARLTATGQVIGTPAYMPPEQVFGRAVCPASDLYALGLTLAETLGGRRVVAGASALDVLLAHVHPGPHALAAAVRESPLGALIARAIEKPIESRFASAAEMRAAVERAVPRAARSTALAVGDTLVVETLMAGPTGVPGPPAGLMAAPRPSLDLVPRPTPAPPRRSDHRVLLAGVVALVAAGGTALAIVIARSATSVAGPPFSAPNGATASAKESSAPTSSALPPGTPRARSLAGVDRDELLARLAQAGFTVTRVLPLTGSGILRGWDVEVARGATRASVSIAHFDSEARAEQDVHERALDNAAVARDEAVTLSVVSADDPAAGRAILDELW